MRIGIYGYYNRQNFGDDLMAALVHHDLRAAGFEVIVFGMTPADAADLGMDTEPDADRLVDRCDALLLGGGGLFIHHNHPWQSVVDGYAELGRLLEKCALQRKEVYGVSLGGSGRTDFPAWQQSAVRFCQQARFFTVRNPEDLAITRSLGRENIEQYPDIVWATPQIFPPLAAARTEHPLVLSNLGSAHSRFSHLVLRLFRWRFGRLRNADVRFVQTPPPKGAPAGAGYRFSRLRDDVAFLASADIVFTTRLHVGLTALSYGVPMVSVYGEQKGRLMLRGVGLEKNFLTGARALGVWLALGRPARLAARLPRLAPEFRRKISTSARNHVARLIDVLREAPRYADRAR
jgi:polysaccharide pyruvyl transferase WcaK-like protein